MSEQRAILVVGLGFGDEGKGSIVDYLVRQTGAHTVVRYNGGAQAAHNVVTAAGRHHTFAQFGSGMLVPGTQTYLSRHMLVEPLSLLKEEQHLRALGITDGLRRLAIDRGALITTPYHQSANRLRELARGSERHGSCGRGIGETMSDYLAFGERVVLAGDLAERSTLLRKLKFVRAEKLAALRELIPSLPQSASARRELAVLQDPTLDEFCASLYAGFAQSVRIVDEAHARQLLRSDGTVIFEGAQGALLDENFGFHPYTTWSTTTLRNAEELLHQQGYRGQVVKVGVLRAYATRHGAGPFVSEDAELTAALRDQHNHTNVWQHEFRAGHFDLVAARYALDIAGPVDCLAVTNLDRLAPLAELKLCDGYMHDAVDEVECADCFEQNGSGLIRRIRAAAEPDLDYQSNLTRLLLKCRAHVERFEPTTRAFHSPERLDAYIHELDKQLQVPVGLTSHGPTALDKRMTESWRQELSHSKTAASRRIPSSRANTAPALVHD